MQQRPVAATVAVALLATCTTTTQGASNLPTPTATPTTATTAAGTQLAKLVDDYFEDYLELRPLTATYIGDPRYNDRLPNSLGPEFRAQVHALDQRYLTAAQKIDANALSSEERISLEIFLRERQRALEEERFPSHLLPINQAGSLLTVMPSLGSAGN